jgi:hypothetical protein
MAMTTMPVPGAFFILEVGKFYGRLVYFSAILYILLPFHIFYGHFGIFYRLGILCQEKSGNPELSLHLPPESI